MKVCIDIQSAIAQQAGVGRYTRHLVEQLGRTAESDDDLSLFYFDFKRKGMPFQVPAAREQVIRWVPGRIVQKAWKTLGWPSFNLFAGRADVYHFPNFIRPPLSSGASVVTIHDAAFLRYPETLEEKNLLYLTRLIKQTLDRTDRIITVSAFTARELIERAGADESKLEVIHSGLDPMFTPPETGQIDMVRQRYGLHRPYLLNIGTVEPRKNLPFLMYVFETLDEDIDLVIAGMKGWKFEPILKRMQTSIKRSRIHYIDYVADGDLPSLYAGAEAFVFPSLYEGFGFTPLEAMRCGTPVVSSTAGSLPEVLGDAAALVEDFDAGAWVQAIRSVLTDTAHRDGLIAAGRDKADSYGWHHTAEQTWNVYRSLA